MGSFNKGFTFIVTTGTYWYVVQQLGQRTWVATVFSHVCPSVGEAEFKGNGKDLYEQLETVAKHNGATFIKRAYSSNSSLRKDMFSILKYGEVR